MLYRHKGENRGSKTLRFPRVRGVHIMMDHSLLVFILGGTAFFLFGMEIASDALQSLAANKIKSLITKFADRPLLGVFSGFAVTVLMQSSGAVTTMLVGLGTAGVVTLPQVMSFILGTGIGTTVTTQLLSLNIAQAGLPIFGIAFTIYFMSSRKSTTRIMRVLMGFGLMFWGLEVIGTGTEGLKDAAFFTSSLEYLKANPFIMLLL